MGEVWRARDPRLNREVAIKVSAQRFTDRFEREARAIAALNHPNICTLYDVGPNYLVMELVEGPTLAERIAEGPIPVEEALALAKQIAGALEAAHEKGIVHRDLKPANIKIRPDGSVKVLDFGLAKAGAETETTPDSPTMLSVSGMILGTAGYMSPEQACGKTVDKRSDIFAFGVVLYEMVTGKRLFDGATVSDSLAAILKEEPDWTLAPEKTRRLLARCLEKDPKKRLRDIGDVELLLEESGGAKGAPARSRFAMAGWIAAVAATTAALALAAWILFRPTPLPAVTRFQIFAPPGSALPLGTPAPSPDGRMLAYTMRGQDGIVRIYVRSLDDTQSRALPGTEGGFHPFWSPDGRSLDFATLDHEIKRIDLAGGSARRLTSVDGPWHGSWNRAGLVLYSTGVSIWQIPADGGASTPAVKPDEKKGETNAGFPFFLSDGKRFLLEMALTGGSRNIELASLGSMDRKIVLRDAVSAPILAPAPNGKVYLLYLRDSSLMAREFDEKAGAVRRTPFVLVSGIGQVADPPIRPTVGVSPGGVLAYQNGANSSNSRLGWYDRSGKSLKDLPQAAGGEDPELSPDGRFAAIERASGTGADIWLVDLARGSSTRLTFESGGKIYWRPIWSPDGKRIAYNLAGGGVYVKDANGTGAEQPLLKSPGVPLSWSPDGRQILFQGPESKLFLLPLADGSGGQVDSDKAPVPVAARVAGIGAEISPDGKYFAFTSGESGRDEVYVEAMPPGIGKWQISIGGGAQPRWRKDGKELFFLSPGLKMMAVDIQTSQAVGAGVPHALFQTTARSAGASYYDVSADGQRFLIATEAGNTVDAPITVVVNWWAGLKNAEGGK